MPGYAFFGLETEEEKRCLGNDATTGAERECHGDFHAHGPNRTDGQRLKAAHGRSPKIALSWPLPQEPDLSLNSRCPSTILGAEVWQVCQASGGA